MDHRVFLTFFETMSDDILRMAKWIKVLGKMDGSLNSTFISLIPKNDHPKYFRDFQHIALCNMIYKKVANIIAMRIKPSQFWFFEG